MNLPWPLLKSGLLTFFICLASIHARSADYFPSPDAQGGWRTLRDAGQIRDVAGMELSRLEQAYEGTQRGTQNGGLLVVRHGFLVFENYFGRAHRNANPDMASTGKAYTSIACGIMLHEFHDKIPNGLDTKVFTEEYLPEAFPLDDPRKASITLGQLLCMTAGYNGEGRGPVGIVNGKASPMKHAPGQNSRALHMASHRPRPKPPGPRHVLHPLPPLDRSRRRLFLLLPRAPHRLHRPPPRHRHGAQ